MEGLGDKDFHGDRLFLELTQDELELHSAKNRDYARGGDPLGNFLRVSAIMQQWPGVDWDSPLGNCVVQMLKQLDAGMWQLAQHFEGEVEDFDQRFRDVHVYAKLARILKRRQQKEVK